MVSQHPHALGQEAYQRGLDRLRRGQRAEALADFQLAVSLHPDLPGAHLALGRLRSDRSPELAVEDFGHVVRLWPDRADGYAARGAALGKLGRIDEALADLDRAVALAPTDPQPYHDRGVVYSRQLRWVEAEEQFSASIRLVPQRSESWFDRGLVRHWLRHDQALADLDQAIRLEPRLARYHFSRGMVLARLGRHEEALSELAFAGRLDPDVKHLHHERGAVLMDVGRADEAIRELGKAIGKGGPRLAEACARRAKLYLDRGEPDKALADLERAVEGGHNDPPLLMSMAGVLVQMGRLPRALELADRALAAAPDLPHAHLCRAGVRQAMGDWQGALADLDFTLRHEPGDGVALDMRAMSLRKTGRFAEAREDYRRAAELTPDDARAQNTLAWFLATCPDDAVRDGAEAARIARRAIELGGDSPDPLHTDTLAAALAEMGDFAKAIELCLQALPKCPRDRQDELRQHLREFRAGRPVRVA